MVNFNLRHNLNRALLLTILSSFTLTCATPLHAAPQIGLNEITFMVQIEKQVEKLLKSKDKSVDKIIEYFIDIKSHIESIYKVKFNLDDCFNQISKELTRQGIQNPKKELDAIKRKIKHKSHANHLYKAKQDKEEVVLPSLLVYGVTVSLCGMFLMCLPMPACKDWGAKLVVAGITASANSLCSKNDENKRKEEN